MVGTLALHISQAELTASNREAYDLFGFGSTVSVFGKMVIICVYGDDDSGDLNLSGSATGLWNETAKIIASSHEKNGITLI